MIRTKHKFSKAKIEKCIVDLPETWGRGVIIQSSKILTVAHAVQWSLEGATMALDPGNYLQVLGKDGQIFAGTVQVVEPVSDIALISGDELVETPDICKLWQSMVETAPFLKLRTAPLPVDTPIPVWTCTPEGKWVAGIGKIYNAKQSHLWAQFEGETRPGTSGSPIVDENGQVVSVISIGSPDPETIQHPHPLPFRCLPVAIAEQFR